MRGLVPQGGPLWAKRTSFQLKRPTMKFLGPAAAIPSRMLERTPATIALIAMTVATPTTIPRMVRAERVLFTRSWSRARIVPSRSISARMLFVPQCDHRIHRRRARRGIDPGQDAHAHTH